MTDWPGPWPHRVGCTCPAAPYCSGRSPYMRVHARGPETQATHPTEDARGAGLGVAPVRGRTKEADYAAPLKTGTRLPWRLLTVVAGVGLVQAVRFYRRHPSGDCDV